MGDLIDIPEWLAQTLFVTTGVVAWFTYAYWKHGRKMRKLAASRPNPAHAEFVALLSTSVDRDIAEWMWRTLLPYYDPLTPHPDDHLLNDACIDDDDIDMDWLPAFAENRGVSWKDWPDWPADWQLTVRNFARFLQLGIAK